MNAVFVRDCRMPFVLAHFATHLTERLALRQYNSSPGGAELAVGYNFSHDGAKRTPVRNAGRQENRIRAPEPGLFMRCAMTTARRHTSAGGAARG